MSDIPTTDNMQRDISGKEEEISLEITSPNVQSQNETQIITTFEENKKETQPDNIQEKDIELVEIKTDAVLQETDAPPRDESPDWRVPIHLFEEAEIKDLKKIKRKKVRKFYKKQNELIKDFREVHEASLKEQSELLKKEEEKKKSFCDIATFCVSLSLGCNILLFALKLAAAITTLSLSIITSAVDSALDLLSGFILWLTNKLRRRRSSKDFYHYPVGKSRLEPIGFIIFACIMGTASLQIVQESIIRIITSATNGGEDKIPPLFFYIGTGIMGFTIITKFILYLICVRFQQYPAVEAYAHDHRNDVFSNLLLLAAVIVAQYAPYCWWLDPACAILVSIYIIYRWVIAIAEHVKKLVGQVAEVDIIQKITHIAYNHSEKIQKIDTVRAFYQGLGLFVELDVVLDGEMKLREAHDIGESLQNKIESIEGVERAFVHVDHEYDHRHDDEHKPIQ